MHIWHTGQGLRDGEVVLPDPREYVKHPRKGGLGLLLDEPFHGRDPFQRNRRADASAA